MVNQRNKAWLGSIFTWSAWHWDTGCTSICWEHEELLIDTEHPDLDPEGILLEVCRPESLLGDWFYPEEFLHSITHQELFSYCAICLLCPSCQSLNLTVLMFLVSSLSVSFISSSSWNQSLWPVSFLYLLFSCVIEAGLFLSVSPFSGV